MLREEELRIIEDYCNNNISIKYRDDFKQHIFMIILELPIINELRDRKKNINYIYKLMKNQNYSKSSSFYYIYKRWDKNRDDIKDE